MLSGYLKAMRPFFNRKDVKRIYKMLKLIFKIRSSI